MHPTAQLTAAEIWKETPAKPKSVEQ